MSNEAHELLSTIHTTRLAEIRPGLFDNRLSINEVTILDTEKTKENLATLTL
jgi:hypothetical protein